MILFIAGYFLAKFVSKIISKILESESIKNSLSNVDKQIGLEDYKISISSAIVKFFYYFIFLIFLLSATDTLGLTVITKELTLLIEYIPTLITSLIILVLGLFCASIARTVVNNAAKSMGVHVWRVLGGLVYYFILITTVISALAQAGIETTLITANVTVVLGGIILAFAIAYGYAARNILAGILINFYNKNQYKIGQIVEIQGIKGEITELDSFSILLNTGSETVVIPIHKLINENVTIFHSDVSTT